MGFYFGFLLLLSILRKLDKTFSSSAAARHAVPADEEGGPARAHVVLPTAAGVTRQALLTLFCFFDGIKFVVTIQAVLSLEAISSRQLLVEAKKIFGGVG